MKPLAYTIALLALGSAGCAPTSETASVSASMADHGDQLAAAVAASTRSPDNVARDAYRNPAQTLAFFGVEPDDLVVEIWPGGGWYTEILGPYLADEGSLALVASERGLTRARAKVAADQESYKSVLFSPVDKPGDATVFPAGSADVVLTFRNVHNWEMGDEPYGADMFASMYTMLRPGGTLGVVEHRLPESRPDSDMKTSGYMKQSYVIALARSAGFELVEASEINANPRDTADHPRGVWTLPPTYRLEDQDRAKYAAIGESDRMTLKFRKPE
ncbi:class I SAM-dependent methyltransferase [Sphingomicrobium flavum]|uniref:class I SAM-dependent methyltransferase n=1 Tax=Sphingomicrobium flavum TaxID=1229164 RepID=UPI0021AD8D72|nr:methyltransferase domain-containing protein [Sphingomicrobium flavum]